MRIAYVYIILLDKPYKQANDNYAQLVYLRSLSL